MEIEQRLLAASWPYWEAEGEIAKRFFAKAGPEDHIFYLKAQLWKELQDSLLQYGAREGSTDVNLAFTDRFLEGIYDNGKLEWP